MSSWNTRGRWLGLALVLAVGTSGSARAQNVVLKLGDPGGAALAKPEPIDILSFSWGASQTATMSISPMDLSAATPSPGVRTVGITKRMDKSSPLIQRALAKRTRFPVATLTVPKGGSTQEYLEITMTDVVISSYQTGGTPDRPTESLSLNFTAIKFNYSEKKKPAAPPGPAKAGYDLKKVGEGAARPEVSGRTSQSLQNDALSAARFSITVDGVEIASFSELAEINTAVEPVTFLLRRGKATGPAMWTWHEAVQTGNMEQARKSASLVMYDYAGKPVARYLLENAWPSKVEISGLTAQGNVSDVEFLKARVSRGGQVAMESVTMVCEHIQRVSS